MEEGKRLLLFSSLTGTMNYKSVLVIVLRSHLVELATNMPEATEFQNLVGMAGLNILLIWALSFTLWHTCVSPNINLIFSKIH